MTFRWPHNGPRALSSRLTNGTRETVLRISASHLHILICKEHGALWEGVPTRSILSREVAISIRGNRVARGKEPWLDMRGRTIMSKTFRSYGPTLSRRDFVRMGGASLAGAALFGVASCGGSEKIGGGQGAGGDSGIFTFAQGLDVLDRKSTRLNSSHANISYAVFCLKKKK